jgi:hypothetical protein
VERIIAMLWKLRIIETRPFDAVAQLSRVRGVAPRL